MSTSRAKPRRYGTVNLAALHGAKAAADREHLHRAAERALQRKPHTTPAAPNVQPPVASHPFRWHRFGHTPVLHPLTIGLLVGIAAVCYLVLAPLLAHQPLIRAKSAPVAPAPVAATAPLPTAAPVVHTAKAVSSANRLTIPAIGVTAPIISVGLDGGALGTPKTLWQVALFTGDAQPGQAGTVVIDGHSGAPGQAGVFRNLSRLKSGDTITVTNGGGQSFIYSVTTSQAYDLTAAASAVLFNSGPNVLNLVSCFGSWQAPTESYTQRWIVSSKLVQ